MDTLILLAIAAGTAAMLLVFFGLRMLSAESTGLVAWRLQRSGRESNRASAVADVTLAAQRSSRLIALDKRMGGLRWASDIRRDLIRANINLHVSEYIVLRFLLALTAMATAALIFGNIVGVVVGIVAGILLWFIPAGLVGKRIARRQWQLTEQLDAALVNISSAVRSGFSFQQALQLSLRQIDSPLKDEFEIALQEVSVGATIEDALSGVAERIECYEFDLVVNAVLVHNAIGGNLGEILDSLAKTLRERRELKGQILALTAQQRLSAWFVAGVPVFMAAFLSATSWEFMRPLWLTTTGNLLLVAGIVLDMLGFLIMRRLTRIDF
jgi:tight adherence protein B